MNRRRGFTLVEMIIVIAVILVLASLMLGVFSSTIRTAEVARTEALVTTLDKACALYKAERGVYPPDDRGDSRCLHFHLGRERVRTLDKDAGPAVTRPPFLEFRADWLEPLAGAPDAKNPAAVVDAWGRKIRYKNPGLQNARHVDLWSSGANGQDGDADDVSNATKIEG